MRESAHRYILALALVAAMVVGLTLPAAAAEESKTSLAQAAAITKADVIIGSIRYGLEGEYGMEGIQNVTYQDKPLSDTQTLVLALNNYRYGGLVSAGLLNESGVVYEGGAVRDMITDYVASLDGPLMPECDNN